ncbi:MAG: radical SAM family heme chaperone HemW [Kangiellaceae bacterium]|nr:radical SAM family heme chaperone HemW [Kangiellaceae bacterium]
MTELPPLSLYLHFPWCVQKCPYCDFNSHAIRDGIPESDYVDALLEDLEQDLPSVWGRQLTSIFIGGGTPSLISVEGMDRLLSGIRARLPFLADTEVTMEANPGTVEADKFKGFFDAGVNRISIGVQSFNNEFLSTLGRIHQADEAVKAFEIARLSGFKNVNIDLMYALPNQSIEQALSDLKIAISLKPEHLSWYQLTLEPNTAFYHSPPKQMATDDLLVDIGEAGLNLLQKNDYQRYEISAFNLNGKSPSWHNTNYWQFGDYLGIGAGAHGKITRADTQQIIRTSKRRSPKDYLNKRKSYIDQTRIIKPQELPLEFMMNAMRLKKGVDVSSFQSRTGIMFSQIESAIQKCREQGLLELETKRILPSDTGFIFLNNILSEFMEDNFPKLNNNETIQFKELK